MGNMARLEQGLGIVYHWRGTLLHLSHLLLRNSCKPSKSLRLYYPVNYRCIKTSEKIVIRFIVLNVMFRVQCCVLCIMIR